MHRFNTELTDIHSTHIFTWYRDSIRFISIRGHNKNPVDPSDIINEWTYKDSDIPLPGNENVRINLWLFNGQKPSDDKEIEIIINEFEFIHQ